MDPSWQVGATRSAFVRGVSVSLECVLGRRGSEFGFRSRVVGFWVSTVGSGDFSVGFWGEEVGLRWRGLPKPKTTWAAVAFSSTYVGVPCALSLAGDGSHAVDYRAAISEASKQAIVF